MGCIRHLSACLLATLLVAGAFAGEQAEKKPVFVRVTLLAPASPWQVQITAYPTRGGEKALSVGRTVSEKTSEKVEPIPAGRSSPWVDFSSFIRGTMSTRFAVQPQGAKAESIVARFDFARTADAQGIVRSVKESDPGGVISFRIPADLVKDKQWLLSIREDTRRRYNELKALKLPNGPLPEKIWYMTGFRSNGQFYTDPAIAQMDFDIIKMLGMNGFWEQNGGQPGKLRGFAHERGIDRSTVYPRQIATPPGDEALGRATRLKWDWLNDWVNQTYSRKLPGNLEDPAGPPTVVADLMDEPGGITFAGPEYEHLFREYLKAKDLTPELFGKKAWDEIVAKPLGWWQFFTIKAQVDMKNEFARRLFYWNVRFWNESTAQAYSLATRRIEEVDRVDQKVIGTRVNFGPPWWYDYGSMPRGIDAYEFGKQRSVSLGFNEDWIGDGNPRWPLEINTYLLDFSRAALRPQQALLGDYITRDSDRGTVKLRTFGCLARECKIFDFYYYGPAYTYFDHWSDNFPMVQGVAELARDLGRVDDVLWDGKAPKAEVALLISRAAHVWEADDSEQLEHMMVYLALLHAGIPCDLVWDAEVADGRFAAAGYKILYVVNEVVPADTARAIEQWVKKGGRLWCSGWAGMRDEYNTPTKAWDAMLGVTSRSWKPTGDLERLGEAIKPDDWRRPAFGRVAAIQTAGNDKTELPALGHGSAEAAAYQRHFGQGLVWVIPWSAGKLYMDGCKERDAKLAHAITYPEKAPAITDMPAKVGLAVPASTSVHQILAWPLWTEKQGVILVANFTGEPAAGKVTVSFVSPTPVEKIRSIKHGSLKFRKTDDGRIECSLPVDEVTDILAVN